MYDEETDAFVLSTSQPLAQGSQAMLSYGDKGNDELLQLFGFVEGPNPHDRFISPISPLLLPNPHDRFIAIGLTLTPTLSPTLTLSLSLSLSLTLLLTHRPDQVHRHRPR